MGTSDLPDMYAQNPRAQPEGCGHTYQANHSCPCYNYNITHTLKCATIPVLIYWSVCGFSWLWYNVNTEFHETLTWDSQFFLVYQQQHSLLMLIWLNTYERFCKLDQPVGSLTYSIIPHHCNTNLVSTNILKAQWLLPPPITSIIIHNTFARFFEHNIQ